MSNEAEKMFKGKAKCRLSGVDVTWHVTIKSTLILTLAGKTVWADILPGWTRQLANRLANALKF